MTIKRYSKDGFHAEHKEGPFVAFEDYAKLQERVERLGACVHALRAIVESADKNQAAVNTALLTDARKTLGALEEK